MITTCMVAVISFTFPLLTSVWQSPTVEIGREVAATPMDRGSGVANNSPVIAVDPTNHRFLVMATRLDAPDFGCGLQVSGDAGRSWSAPSALPTLPVGADKCYGPEIAFDKRGRLYLLLVGLAGNGNRPVGAFLATSDDRAHTFTAPRQVLGALNFGIRMALDSSRGARGRIQLVWIHSTGAPALGGFSPGPNPILAAHSDDGGIGFSDPVQVSDPARSRAVAPSLSVSGKYVYVGYYDLGRDRVDYEGLEGPVWDGRWSLVTARSEDSGGHFESSVVDNGIVPSQRVMLIFTMPPASVASDGRKICAAWTDARNGDDDALLRCSSDGGISWGRLRRVNHDAIGNGHSQYLPRIDLGRGRLDAIFYDRRSDPANLRNDVYYTYSLDGGRRFSPDERLTTQGSDITIGQEYAVTSAKDQVEFGARLALARTGNRLVAAWADTRNSNSHSTGQDVFSAVVSLPDRDNVSVRLGVAAMVVFLFGAATGAVLSSWSRRRCQPSPAHDFGGMSAVVLIVIAAVLSSCASNRRPALPTPPSVVDVDMTEFSFRYSPPRSGGRVVFRVRNIGRLDHALTLTPLSEDTPPIDQQLHGSVRRILPQFAGTFSVRPGQVDTFTVNLLAGQRYALLCGLFSGTDAPHDLLGMSSEFRTRAPAPRG